MRRAVAILLLTLLTACADKGEAPAPELDELRGQWVVINYWAQWCKPCIEEIPELSKPVSIVNLVKYSKPKLL